MAAESFAASNDLKFWRYPGGFQGLAIKEAWSGEHCPKCGQRCEPYRLQLIDRPYAPEDVVVCPTTGLLIDVTAITTAKSVHPNQAVHETFHNTSQGFTESFESLPSIEDNEDHALDDQGKLSHCFSCERELIASQSSKLNVPNATYPLTNRFSLKIYRNPLTCTS